MLLPTFLSTILDHRRAQGRRYRLEHVLLFSILAILSDATSYRKIQHFIAARLPQLNALCGLHWKRAPAHTAIRYTLQGLDPPDYPQVLQNLKIGMSYKQSILNAATCKY